MAVKNTIDAEAVRPRVERFLAERLPGAQDVQVSDVAVSAASGLSCETVLLEAGWSEDGEQKRQAFAARVAPDPSDEAPRLFPEYDLELEARIMQGLHRSTEVPVPNVLFVESDPSVLGGPFLMMERIDGRVPPDDPPYTVEGWVLELSPEQQGGLVEQGVQVLAGIHGADWRGLGLGALDRSERGAPGIDQYIGEAEHLYTTGNRGIAHPVLEAGLAWAKESRPDDEGEMVLNWGDARIGNIIFDDEGSAAGVLDWEMASISSRDQDLAYFLFTLDFFTVGLGGAPNPPGFPQEAEILARYEQLTGHTPQNIDYYKGLSALMGAVILMRVGWVLIENELLPADSPMPHNNPGSQTLTHYLDLPAPSGSLTDWTGVR